MPSRLGFLIQRFSQLLTDLNQSAKNDAVDVLIGEKLKQGQSPANAKSAVLNDLQTKITKMQIIDARTPITLSDYKRLKGIPVSNAVKEPH